MTTINNIHLDIPIGFRIIVPVFLAKIKPPVKLVLHQMDIVVCVTQDSRVWTAKLVREM